MKQLTEIIQQSTARMKRKYIDLSIDGGDEVY